MKTINVTELKAHLSKYLRMASHGSRIVVKDRDEPIAQLGPLQPEALSWRERMTQEGRLRPGTQDWQNLEIEKLDRRIDIQGSLRVVREDAREVRPR
jgi:antitoxin (DNA-binding transcriptional repressor) of toxin-antitoxin stability system